jgi:hypothetical protein
MACRSPVPEPTKLPSGDIEDVRSSALPARQRTGSFGHGFRRVKRDAPCGGARRRSPRAEVLLSRLGDATLAMLSADPHVA